MEIAPGERPEPERTILGGGRHPVQLQGAIGIAVRLDRFNPAHGRAGHGFAALADDLAGDVTARLEDELMEREDLAGDNRSPRRGMGCGLDNHCVSAWFWF